MRAIFDSHITYIQIGTKMNTKTHKETKKSQKSQLIVLASEAIAMLADKVAHHSPAIIVPPDSPDGLFAAQVTRERVFLTEHLRNFSQTISEKDESLHAPGQRIIRLALCDLIHPGDSTRKPGVMLEWAIQAAKGVPTAHAVSLPSVCKAVDAIHDLPEGTFLMSLKDTGDKLRTLSDSLLPICHFAVSAILQEGALAGPVGVGVGMLRLQSFLGKAVCEGVRTTIFANTNGEAIAYIDKRAATCHSQFAKKACYTQALQEKKTSARLKPVATTFSDDENQKIGAIFVYFLEMIGVITVIKEEKQGKLSFELSATCISKLARSVAFSALKFTGRPMICPPVTFSAGVDGGLFGGYITTPSALIRSKNRNDYSEDLANAVRLQKFSLAPIHAIQEIPYKVDLELLNRIESALELGHAVGKLLPAFKDPKPAPIDVNASEEVQKAQRRALAIWYKAGGDKKSAMAAKIRASYALLRMARLESDEKALFFPVAMDFRGRVYQGGRSGLSPQGGKEAKALLVFSEAFPVSVEVARRGLCLSLAAALGYDKVSLDIRLEKTLQGIEEAYAWVTGDSMGWLAADDPAGALSAALSLYEIRNREPQEVLTDARACYALYRVDGTCNGLQHIATLCRDEALAKSVAVIGGEKPADLYTEVGLEAIKVLRDTVAGLEMTFVKPPSALKEGETISGYTAATLESRRATAGRLLELFDAKPALLRKLSKSPTMTHGYGSTSNGKISAVLNVIDELCEEGKLPVGFLKEDEKGSTTRDKAALATIFGSAVNMALARKISGLTTVSGFLRKISGVLSKADIVTTWTTPDGFPVFCPYYEQARGKIKVRLANGNRADIVKLDDTSKIATGKSKTGVCPNFIHSLDATHLRFCVTALSHKNIPVVTVHDSFGVPLSYADELDRTLRDTFCDLYSNNPLKAFLDESRIKLQNVGRDDLIGQLPSIPDAGALNLESVKKSVYFFN